MEKSTLLQKKLPSFSGISIKQTNLVLFFILLNAISFGQVNLQITEIFSGQSGTDLTADWFEIKNTGSTAWVSGVDADLYYDDESADPVDATLIEGITNIQPGAAVIVVLGISSDATDFYTVWSPVANLTGIEIGYTDGAGLGGGGDAVTLWMGDPNSTSPVDTASYPDTAPADGQSYDVSLSAFSTVGNANDAVQTIAMGGNNDVPNIGSPGDQGPFVADPNAPVITANLNNTTPLLNVTMHGPSAISGVINDPTDPATTSGIEFKLEDLDTPLSNLEVSATSDNQSVVTDANLMLTGNDSVKTLTITPTGVGYANITVTVTDSDLKTDTYMISYAASAAAINPSTSRFHTGTSDGSTAITVGTDYMWVGDDENQTIRLYDRFNSGYPVNEVNFDSEVGSVEKDLEGSFRDGNTIYWMGSHTEADRSMIFSVTESGSGATTTLTYTGQYPYLRDDLISWDDNNGHGKGAGYYSLSTLMEVEGLAADPNNASGALVALRGPLVDGKAVIIPVTNFKTIVSASPTSGSATFGTPIEMNLGLHSFRSIECDNNGCLIIGGPVGTVTDFRLFTWSGNPVDEPELRSADIMSLITLGSYEGIVGLPSVPFTGSNGDNLDVQLLVDMGTFDYYNDGTEAKDLSHGEWKKFRSETVTLGAVEMLPAATPGDIIITEVMQNPDSVSDANGEWFEIYNTTIASIDIDGWSIYDNGTNTHTINNGGPLVIPAGGYLILGLNTDSLTNGYMHVDYDYGTSSTFSLGNGDDELIIKTPGGIVIDSIAWDGGPNWPDPTGASMSLQNPNLDNNDGANWCVSSTPYGMGDFGTPGMMNDCPLPPAADLQVTEVWVGQTSGDDLTADWFEITNFGTVDWVSGVDSNLYYDDDSQDPVVADLINDINIIPAGKSVIVVIGDQTDAANFHTVWSPVYDLNTVDIGWSNGSGLGQGGDGVTLFLGTPAPGTIVDFASFSAVPSGVSYDFVLADFSQEGVGTAQTGSNVAAATIALNSGNEPAIGSPGNRGPLDLTDYVLRVTEIFAGQAGTDLTADWFEITNIGSEAWVSGTNADLYYDDVSQEPLDATLIEGITSIQPGSKAIVMIGDQTDATNFLTVWSPVQDFTGIDVGYTIGGAGLGGGGDLVTLWAGDPNLFNPVDTASYPDTAPADGQSYDVILREFSTVGNTNNAVQTLAMGGNASDVPNIGSPGNLITSISNVANDNAISIYPNPGNGLFHIRTDNEKLVVAKVYDLTGKMVFTKNFNESNNGYIDISDLENAVFFLHLQTENDVKVIKINKQ